MLIKSMLLFSQGCLDLDVSGPITAFKQIVLRKYFPDENNADNNRYNISHRRYRNDIQVIWVHPRFLVGFVLLDL
jgi:hypothetical protein